MRLTLYITSNLIVKEHPFLSVFCTPIHTVLFYPYKILTNTKLGTYAQQHTSLYDLYDHHRYHIDTLITMNDARWRDLCQFDSHTHPQRVTATISGIANTIANNNINNI